MQNPPRTAGELLEALRLTGRAGDVLARVTDPKTPGWANILARGATFTWEVWKPLDSNGDSMSHGWGSNVLVEIQRAVLGVTSTGPGYVSFAVAPPRTGLTWASGRVPTPRGFIGVAWHRQPGSPDALTLTLTVPVSSTASVQLAAPDPAHITENGQALGHTAGVQLMSSAPGTAVLSVGAGTYHLRVR